mgnify:CR=1 FL=1
MDSFTKQYLITALWAETDGQEPLDSNYELTDISEETVNQAQKDCEEFRKKAGTLTDGIEESQVAHDFWLTRNGHGAGFWDRGYENQIGEKLTSIAKEFKEISLYVGDDGKIYS